MAVSNENLMHNIEPQMKVRTYLAAVESTDAAKQKLQTHGVHFAESNMLKVSIRRRTSRCFNDR